MVIVNCLEMEFAYVALFKVFDVVCLLYRVCPVQSVRHLRWFLRAQ